MRRLVVAVYIYVYVYIYAKILAEHFAFYPEDRGRGHSETLLSTIETTLSHTVKECSFGESECKQKPHLYYYKYKRMQNI
jgi:hypothetical protein